MITAYIFILVFSAWLLAHGLVMASTRILPLLGYSTPKSMVALAVAIAMLTVVSATPWVLVLAIAAAFIPFSRLGLTLNLPTMLPWLITLGLLMALAFAPILGAPGFLAVNAAIMGAALLGILTVSPGLPALGRAFPSFLVIIVGIPLKLAILYGIHAA